VPADPSSPIPAALARLAHAQPLRDSGPPHLLAYLASAPDPRAARGRRHRLVAILGLAAAAVLAGARSIAAIAEFLVTVSHFGFPHAAQVLQVTRKTRDLGTRRWHTMVVYAITSLGFAQARPARLADLIRGHWTIENGLHWVRDVTFNEDASQLRTGTAPQVMACLRNLVIGVLSRAGPVNLAAALRHHSRDPHRPLATLGITLALRENAAALLQRETDGWLHSWGDKFTRWSTASIGTSGSPAIPSESWGGPVISASHRLGPRHRAAAAQRRTPLPGRHDRQCSTPGGGVFGSFPSRISCRIVHDCLTVY
jgi:DDE_Tnp_1-associated/Transposase DDE domain